MKEEKYLNRTILLETITEKKFSLTTENKIMSLFGRLKPEQKELIAEQAISLVRKAETEQEAINIIENLIETA